MPSSSEVEPGGGIRARSDPHRMAMLKASGAMIDGLRLTMTGEEMQRRIDERLTQYRQAARSGGAGGARPEETVRLEHRVAMLEFIRDHIEPLEVYRIGEADLAFGELLPSPAVGGGEGVYADSGVGAADYNALFDRSRRARR